MLDNKTSFCLKEVLGRCYFRWESLEKTMLGTLIHSLIILNGINWCNLAEVRNTNCDSLEADRFPYFTSVN